jgi:hypothetical protein
MQVRHRERQANLRRSLRKGPQKGHRIRAAGNGHGDPQAGVKALTIEAGRGCHALML